MKTNNTAWCPECQEVFPYDHHKPACPSCTNRNVILLSRILDRKEEHHDKDDPNRDVGDVTKLDQLSSDEPSTTIECSSESSERNNGDKTRKHSWGEKAASSQFVLGSIEAFRSFRRVLNITIQYGEQLQRKGSFLKGIQGIDADSPRSVLSRC